MRYGTFDDEHREYVIDRVDAPFSMTNYLGTQRMGAVVSQNAGGYCWLDSPQHHRITRFRPNGVPMDWPGHYVYLRDEETGRYWSLSWQPTGLPLAEPAPNTPPTAARDTAPGAPAAAQYEARHGLSYSAYRCFHEGIRASQTLFIPREEDPSRDPVEIFDVRIRNESSRERRLSVTGYVEFSFHEIDMDNQNFQMSLYAAGSHFDRGAVLCELHYEPEAYQFFAAGFVPDGFEGVREAFIGPYRTERNPLALETGRMTGSLELGGNPCGALKKNLTLAPGEEARLLFYLGTGRGDAAEEARRRYDAAGTDRAFAALRDYWEEKLSALRVKTPHENMNRSLNIWNLYQSEVNVLFSRFASFIEVGGRTGLGYRDTAQDAMCIPHAEPAMCEKRILQLLHGQMSQGYGLHLFDPAVLEKADRQDPDSGSENSPTVIPETGKQSMLHGLKDACADDALWLIPAIVENVRESGDLSFFDRPVPYADEGEDTVWGHMKRALDFSYVQVGAHGITLGLRADWNDCLNLGGGESAMVAFLLIWATNHFLDAARALAQAANSAQAPAQTAQSAPGRSSALEADIRKYTALKQEMEKRCAETLWDGEWYLRGITAAGKPIGTHTAAEGKVHLESNAWAVVSGAAGQERGRSCMDAVDAWLYTPWGLTLNAPSFRTRDDSVGFVTRVYPGIKENGAIFSHPNPWAWVAECMLGRGDRAMKFYDALLPENQNDRMEVRQAEPYSYCQFIMGPDHTAFGRARHPFMTGSSGWAYYAATRYMLGIRPGFGALTVDPCIPKEWNGFEAVRRWRGAEYRIRVTNPRHVEKGVARLTVDGHSEAVSPLAAGARIPIFPSGIHEIEIEMG